MCEVLGLVWLAVEDGRSAKGVGWLPSWRWSWKRWCRPRSTWRIRLMSF